jgi:hypothetical protein
MTEGRRWLAMLVTGLLALAGCTVGTGSGGAAGALYVKDCTPDTPDSDGNYGEPMAPAKYELLPEFFAGEPIEDIRRDGGENRLVVRVETFEKSIRRSAGIAAVGPFKDMVVFDIRTVPVGRCMRAAAIGMTDPSIASFCQITPGSKMPRIRVGPEQPIRAGFVPRKTCPRNIYVVGTARGDDPVVGGVPAPLTADQWPSWVDLLEFGKVPSGEDPNFKVEFGERVHVKEFHLDLEDDRVLQAPRLHEPPPESEINGNLHGYFDFDLERGQGAQTFP